MYGDIKLVGCVFKTHKALFWLYCIWSNYPTDLYLHTHLKTVSYLLIKQYLDTCTDILQTEYAGGKKGTSRYKQSPPVGQARVSKYLCAIFVISLIFRRFEIQRKRQYKTINHLSILIIIITTYIEVHYRKAKQRVSSHLNTNSRLLNFRKYKHTNSSALYKI